MIIFTLLSLQKFIKISIRYRRFVVPSRSTTILKSPYTSKFDSLSHSTRYLYVTPTKNIYNHSHPLEFISEILYYLKLKLMKEIC